jgi:hypothetical protein
MNWRSFRIVGHAPFPAASKVASTDIVNKEKLNPDGLWPGAVFSIQSPYLYLLAASGPLLLPSTIRTNRM